MSKTAQIDREIQANLNLCLTEAFLWAVRVHFKVSWGYFRGCPAIFLSNLPPPPPSSSHSFGSTHFSFWSSILILFSQGQDGTPGVPGNDGDKGAKVNAACSFSISFVEPQQTSKTNRFQNITVFANWSIVNHCKRNSRIWRPGRVIENYMCLTTGWPRTTGTCRTSGNNWRSGELAYFEQPECTFGLFRYILIFLTTSFLDILLLGSTNELCSAVTETENEQELILRCRVYIVNLDLLSIFFILLSTSPREALLTFSPVLFFWFRVKLVRVDSMALQAVPEKM